MRPTLFRRGLLEMARKVCVVAFLFILAGVAPAQLSVATTVPKKTGMTLQLRVKGDVHPLFRTTLKARVTGYVSGLTVEDGDVVEGKTPLAKIAVPELDAKVEEALALKAMADAMIVECRAAVEEAGEDVKLLAEDINVRQQEVGLRETEVTIKQILHRRLLRMQQKRAATEEQVQEAEAEVDMARAKKAGATAAVAKARAAVEAARAKQRSAEARLASARAKVKEADAKMTAVRTMQQFAVLKSPFAKAIVERRHVDDGALLEAEKTPVVTLVDVSSVRVRFDVVEAFALRVGVGAKVDIWLASDPANPVRDQPIKRAAGTIDMRTRSRRMEVVLANPSRRFLPGGFVYVQIDITSRPGALVLPAQCIIKNRGLPKVMVVRDGKLDEVSVTVGLDDGKQAEVLAGLRGGEQVVVRGQGGLRKGDAVVASPIGGAK